MLELTQAQVTARRLVRSHLVDPAPRERLVDVVRDVALIQAQVLSAASIGIAIRVAGATAADVEHELYTRRSLVKTWSIRGTLHLVPADELPLWAAAARGNGRYWETREWEKTHDLPRGGGRAVVDAIADSLRGTCLTRVELADAVTERLGRRHEQLLSGWGQLLHAPAVEGTLCFGPPRGANVTFVRADEWIGGWRDEDPTAARREVLRRFLHAYGPSKPSDFAAWSGFGRDAVKTLFADLAPELEEVKVDRGRFWILRGDHDDFDGNPVSIRLLPQYDAYVLGYRPRAPLVPQAVKERIREDSKGRYETVTGMSSLLVDGIVTGLWRRSQGTVAVEHVLPLRRGRKGELDVEVARMREIVSSA